MSRCEAARLEPPDPPEPMFDSLENCMAERCGIDADCDDCVEPHCLCRDWQDETKDDYTKEDYDDN